MLSFFIRRKLRAAAKHYGYDVSYLDDMLTQSPRAFFKFVLLGAASSHREVVPVEASFAAKISGAMAEDCGPCAQLAVDMALEAGMAKDQVAAVIRRDLAAMSVETALGFGFADAILHRSDDQEFRREAVRVCWGDKGVIDLAMALQTSRLFPMVKLALGHARECRNVSVDGHEINVIKQAA